MMEVRANVFTIFCFRIFVLIIFAVRTEMMYGKVFGATCLEMGPVDLGLTTHTAQDPFVRNHSTLLVIPAGVGRKEKSNKHFQSEFFQIDLEASCLIVL